MLKDSLVALGYLKVERATRPGRRQPAPSEPAGSARCRCAGGSRHRACSFPRWRRSRSGFAAGILTVFLGIGGGFILVPAMIYLLGMPARVVIGTSLVMVLAVSAATTMIHAMTTQAVDIVLAALLLFGGVVGAQYGALLTLRIKPDLLRLALAVIILLVALRMLLGLAWRPDEIFSIEFL